METISAEGTPWTEQTVDNPNGKISFCWDKPPRDNWAGYSKTDLVSLVGRVAQVINITQTEARKIEICFADHKIPLVDGEKHISFAVCLPWQNLKGEYTYIQVLFNRSKEILMNKLDQKDILDEPEKKAHHSSGVISELADSRFVGCEITTPFEEIVWSVAEELKHAQVSLRAGTQERELAWEQRYLSFLRRKNFKTAYPYDASLQEVTASRAALKALQVLTGGTSIERSYYFYQIRQQSIVECRSAIPTIAQKVVDSTYIETGFDPKSIH